jgi:hypothetical protein
MCDTCNVLVLQAEEQTAAGIAPVFLPTVLQHTFSFILIKDKS